MKITCPPCPQRGLPRNQVFDGARLAVISKRWRPRENTGL